mgnify:CR=1 FL=1
MGYDETGIFNSFKRVIKVKNKLDIVELQLTKERMKNELLMQALGEIETYDSVHEMPTKHIAARALREVNEV